MLTDAAVLAWGDVKLAETMTFEPAGGAEGAAVIVAVMSAGV